MKAGGFHDAQDLFEQSERAFRYGKDSAAVQRLGLRVADCLEGWADSAKHSAMTEAHWLQQCIAKLREVPGTNERRKALQERLNTVQSNIRDEMGVFSHEADISEIVKASRDEVSGKSFIRSLGLFVSLYKSPEASAIRREASETARNHPFAALITASVHDGDGRMVGTLPAVKNLDDPEDDGLIGIILREASARRSLIVSGAIEPARRVIVTEHYVDEGCLAHLLSMSPFVPSDRVGIYVKGFNRFFGGDFISAFSVLCPQLENSIRYILRQTGLDVSKINADLTQELITLSIMLSSHKDILEEIFGADLIMDIDILFNRRGGPSLRHGLAHGLIEDRAFYGSDVIYACWLMFRLCLMPMFSDWGTVEKRWNEGSA